MFKALFMSPILILANECPSASPDWVCAAGNPNCIDGTPAVVAEEVPANLKIAMFGDQGISSKAAAVLDMLKEESVDMIILAGDIGYAGTTTKGWKDQLAASFSDDFPFLIAAGNHDWDFDWTKEETLQVIHERAMKLGTCHGFTGVDMVCTYKGITIVIVAAGVTGEDHDMYIAKAFAKYPSRWRICVWHKNQRNMQLGGKVDSPGWPVYEECRRQGAIISTGHEHSYGRTFTMTSFIDQAIAPNPSLDVPLLLQPEMVDGSGAVTTKGTSFCFVAGTAGVSIRQFQDDLEKNPWWASALAADSPEPLKQGAVICEFNVDGKDDEAACRYKQYDGVVRDTFRIKTLVDLSATEVATEEEEEHVFVTARVASVNDDVEEKDDGSIDCTSSDLELADDGTMTGRTVAVRFDSVDLDPALASEILEARIEFRVDELTPDEPAALTFTAERAPDSGMLCDDKNKPSTRPRTTASVSWSPGAWDGVAEGTNKDDSIPSPDLKALVQEVITLPGWTKGGPISFFIEGTGTRTARSYDNDACKAAKLVIELGIPRDTKDTTKSATTDDCAVGTWTDLKKDCGPCKLLLNNAQQYEGRCDKYCQSIGRQCTGSWDDGDSNGCAPSETGTCTTEWSGTSDIICQCSGATTDNCDVGTWKDLKEDCGPCKLLVKNAEQYEGRCDKYCQSIGRQCTGSWDDGDINGCAPSETGTCTTEWSGTSDIICQCSGAGSEANFGSQTLTTTAFTTAGPTAGLPSLSASAAFVVTAGAMYFAAALLHGL